MVSPFTLPPTGFGPGSQPEPDGELQYMAMPSGMRTYSPHVPDVNDKAALDEALAMLSQMADACQKAADGGGHTGFDLTTMTTKGRAALADALGQGEVSMKLRGNPSIRVQETVFAGLWLLAGDGVDRAEVAPFPGLARSRAHIPHKPAVGALARKKQGVVNGPSILAELMDKSTKHHPGKAAEIINLSLLPHTPEDLEFLDEALGEGAAVVLSRGYGNCRLTALAQNYVWRVQFFNSMDQLILDTFEVTEVPEVALAADEDLRDSAFRIRDVMEAIA